MKFKIRSVFLKVFILTLFLMIVSISILSTIAIIEESRIIESRILQEYEALAKIAARSIEAGYAARLWPFETLKQIEESPEVLFWWIVKPDGEIYLANDAEMWGKRIEDSSVGTTKTIVKDVFFPEANERIKVIVHPLNIKEAGKNWSFYLGVSLDPIVTARNKLIVVSLEIFIPILILSTLLTFYFAKTITRPLEILGERMKSMSKGEIDHEVKIKTGDEIEELADAFNQMIKELKKSREKIKKYSKELEREVRERTKELNEKVEELERTKAVLKKSFKELKKLDVEKDRFISIAAHELKTPLAALHGFSQLLQDERVANDQEKRKRFLKIIEEETIRLSNLVTNFLELSRFDLGALKITIEEVNIPELLNSIKEQMIESAREKGLELKVEVDEKLPRIKTDKEKLREILINLVHNSIKFTEKGEIKMSCKRANSYVEFSVSDTGIGIPEEAQSKIFTRFFQVESPYTRKTKGSGLGLSVCKALVESLGGKIWFKSKLGKGTTFYFTIPIKTKKSSLKSRRI